MISSWTEERTDKLTALWNAGHSASVIAGMLGGVTRNAVIGRVHRMKLARRAETREVKAMYSKRGGKVAHAQKRVREGKPPTAIRKGLTAWPSDKMHLKTREPLPGAKLVAIADLEASHCTWTHGEGEATRYCGCAAVPGTNWCSSHLSVVYRPIQPRSQRDGAKDFVLYHTRQGAMA